MKTQYKVILAALLIILADQVLKIWVKTNFCLGQDVPLLGDRVYLYFIENPGMAFGMQFFGSAGKFMLTLLRIVFIAIIGVYIGKLIRIGAQKQVIYALAVMLAGAAGNLFDCLFYGLLFNESTSSSTADIFPALGGYAPFMFGKVVDMFYCPVINCILPDWFPVWGGERFIFFRPVFNIADAAITCSVFYLLIFQRKNTMRLLNSKSRDPVKSD